LADVLDLLAGLLSVTGSLVGHALGLEALVADGLARRLLGLALEFLGLVLGLVSGTHDRSFPSWSFRTAFPLPMRCASNPVGPGSVIRLARVTWVVLWPRGR